MPLYLKRIAERKRHDALETIANWSMMLDIAAAPHTRNASGVRQLRNELKRLRRLIETSAIESPEHELEIHRKLIELNRRRMERRTG